MRYRRVLIPGASYFFTLVVHERAPIFSDPVTIDFYRQAACKVQRAWPFTLEAEVILPDHVHLLFTLPDDDRDYPTRVHLSRLHTFVSESATAARGAIPQPGQEGEQAVWQRRYWQHLIRDEQDFQAHLDYIHINPVKHGLVAAARDWPHSTFLAWVERGVYDLTWGSDEIPPLPECAGRE